MILAFRYLILGGAAYVIIEGFFNQPAGRSSGIFVFTAAVFVEVASRSRMQESELWITRIFNDHLAGLGNAFLSLVGIHAQARPWVDSWSWRSWWRCCWAFLFPVLRARLSFDRPGTFQQIFEMLYGFVRGQAEDQVGPSAHRYLAFFGTLFVFYPNL